MTMAVFNKLMARGIIPRKFTAVLDCPLAAIIIAGPIVSTSTPPPQR
jgi:hypothetical protein